MLPTPTAHIESWLGDDVRCEWCGPKRGTALVPWELWEAVAARLPLLIIDSERSVRMFLVVRSDYPGGAD